jgi:hypothetical protein
MANRRATAATVQKRFCYYRQVLAVEDLGAEEIAAIRQARIPKSRRYKLANLKGR